MKINDGFIVGLCPECGNPLRSTDSWCPRCGKLIMSAPAVREGICGNCGESLGTGDNYCRLCGTKAGEGAFLPRRNIMQCVYGPAPVNRTHTCTECGYSWTTCLMIDDEKYCPKCGGSAPYTEEDE